MNNPLSHFVILLITTLVLTGGGASHANAQGKASDSAATDEVKVLVNNDKVIVTEERLRLGAQSASKARPYRVVRALKGGSIQRIFPDGKKATAQWKTGEVKVFEATEPYAIRNVGSTEVVFYIVSPK
jgi:hypothetical protein